MTNPLITVIGSLNTDLVTRTSRIPAAGETLISQSFDTGSGGKGANQAVACARLSHAKASPNHGSVKVEMIGAVGDDLFGSSLVEDLQRNGISTDGIRVHQGQKSGVAVIIVDEKTGENRILMSPNANFSLRPETFTDLPAPKPDLIVLQLEIPLDTVLQILDLAHRHGIETLLNPAPAKKLPENAYSKITHLIVNESEASILTGDDQNKYDWTTIGAGWEALTRLGSRHVVVTLGSQGLCYTNCNVKGDKFEHEFLSAKKVPVKDTTAAGDTFVGAYAAAIATTKDRDFRHMMDIVAKANKAAAVTVQREGAQSSIPWADEVSS